MGCIQMDTSPDGYVSAWILSGWICLRSDALRLDRLTRQLDPSTLKLCESLKVDVSLLTRQLDPSTARLMR